ncbi:MAG TPA: TonB-dependent receptor [Pyrinomonadaceae bacterium]
MFGKLFPRKLLRALLCVALASVAASARQAQERVLSGTVETARGEVVPGVTVLARTEAGEERRARTDAEGNFRLRVPAGETVSVKFFGADIALTARAFRPADATENLRVRVALVVQPVHESVVIVSDALEPGVERRNESIYRNGLFARDDQLLQTLAAGIDAGQHEGGGKSLEIRRFGFNADHGGVGGGLKVLISDVQQNQATQGHGQGYLGQLKSLTPELVESVDILNGPFNAQYGDFSGLGVVHIRLRESLPQRLTARLQLGSFDTRRAFLAYSPRIKNAETFVAYEGTRADGPFASPLRYKRDNLSGNYTRNFGTAAALGFKFNAGRNDFNSSGQIPLDEVAAGRLDRFGFVDPDNGGRVRAATAALYFRREWDGGRVFKADAYLTRSLFDLWSNFTFFLADENFGDEIQQHDSRSQEGGGVQYLHPHRLGTSPALLTAGAQVAAAQINVGLYPSAGRNPNRLELNQAIGVANPGVLLTDARARLLNTAAYAQYGLDLLEGHLHVDAGLRLDHFRFAVDDHAAPANSGARAAARLQPKLSVSYWPTSHLPAVFFFNYGRGVSSQDARGVVQQPGAPAVSTTDFYQAGTLYKISRLSVSATGFLIDRSNEQVYVPDDGSIELFGPSRANGFELRSSVQIVRRLALDAGLTRVMNAFFRGTLPRVYVDSAPHTVANAALTLTDWRGTNASLRFRHTGGYRLDGEDASIRAAGLDVLDLGLSHRLRPYLDLNFALDNVLGKRYFETQNFFESRLRPGDPAVSRAHATPGYPRAFTAGVTLRFFEK